ncbi:MAG: N-acetylneuraminate synthase family protein [Phycisphaerales bacterium]
MQIGDRTIGINHRPYIIAEIGVNHDGEVSRALELTDAAADAGADAVKLQLFETDRLMSKSAKLAVYQKNAGETDPIEMLRRLELTIDEMGLVVDRAHGRGIHAIVTVFNTELVETAETLAWDAYKTASPDIVNRPLLEALMATGKPMIVSTGASTLDEVVRAVGWLDEARDRLAVLQCVSCYPAPENAIGGIIAIASTTGLPTGFSDHLLATRHADLPVAAGACLLEKHVTDDRTRQGPDHGASILTGQLSQYIESAQKGIYGRAWVEFLKQSHRHSMGVAEAKLWSREVDFPEAESRFLGWRVHQCETVKRVLDCERDVREVSRQSVVSACDIAPGSTITRDMLTIKRPGTGVLAYEIDTVVGRVATRAIEADVPIVEEDLE